MIQRDGQRDEQREPVEIPDGTPCRDSALVTNDTLYDLASVTKMFSVNYALQKLLTDGKVDLDAPVADFLGEEFVTETVQVMVNTKGERKDPATLTDLAKLASVMLTGGYGETEYFSRDVMDLFTAPKSKEAANRGLGWWRQGDGLRSAHFGTQASPETFGHQGFTGTLVMIDPGRQLVIVYLTNKVNSPVTDVQTNANKFDGGWYTAGTLGFVPQILSIGMDSDEDVTGQLREVTAKMAAEALEKIPKGVSPDSDHPAVKNATSKQQLKEIYLSD